MNTQSENARSVATPPQFRRKGKMIEYNPLKLEIGKSAYVKFNSSSEFQFRNGTKATQIQVTNLETGELQVLWADGGLRGTLAGIGGIAMALGRSFELKKTGSKEIEHDEQGTVEVNSYEVYELEVDPRKN